MWQKIKVFLFENRTSGQTVVKNVIWLGFSNIGGRALRALVIIYAARVLGAAGWGTFSYAITLAALLTIFTDFGINGLLVRETSRAADHAEKTRILSTTFFLRLAFSAVAVLVIIFLAPRAATLPEAAAILPIVALVLFFDAFRDFGFSVIRAMEKMEWETGLFLATNLVIVGCGIVFLNLSPTVEAFTWAYAAGSGFGMLLTFWAIRNYLRDLFRRFTRRLVRPILLAAWPFALSGILGGLMVNTDVLVIGWLGSATDVGFYSAAQRIILLLYILPGVFAGSVLPLLSRLAHQREDAKARIALETVLAACCAISLPIFAGGILLAEPLIRLLFGASFLPGTLSLQILLGAVPLSFVAILLGDFMFAYEKQKKLAVYAGIGGALNVILDILLVPLWGIAGSAVATLFVQIVSTAYLWHEARKVVPFGLTGRIARMFVAVGAMVILILLLRPLGLSLFVLVPLAAAAYFLALYFLKEPLFKDISSVLFSRP